MMKLSEPVVLARTTKMPGSLSSALSVKYEYPISINYPVPLTGRIDQLYLTDDIRCIVFETKIRSRAYITWKDILQVSMYRMMVQRRRPVWKEVVENNHVSFPEYAWLHVVNSNADEGRYSDPGEDVYFQVETYPPSAIIELWLKYFAYSDTTAKNGTRLRA